MPGMPPPGMGGGPPPGPEKTTPFRLWVTFREAGKVIGRGGECVRDLKERTGCEIKVEKTDPGEHATERCFILTGDLEAQRLAYKGIWDDVTWMKGEEGTIKDTNMSPPEAHHNMVMNGPGGPPQGYPPPGMPIPGMPPPGAEGSPPPGFG